MGTRINTLKLDHLAADPAAPAEGEIWFNLTTLEIRARIGGTTVTVAPVSGGDTHLVQWAEEIIRTPYGIDAVELEGATGLGMVQTVFASEAALNLAHPPLGVTAPGWAVVRDGGFHPKVFWFQLGGTVWQESTWVDLQGAYYPPENPLGVETPKRVDGNFGPEGNNWTYYMGPFGIITAAGAGKNIHDIFFMFGNGGGGSHQWQIRKSTVIGGASSPPANTYTILVASGQAPYTTSQTWEEAVSGLVLPVAIGEWYWVGSFQGSGFGSYEPISSLDAANMLNDDYFDIRGGAYVSVGGGLPGGGTLNPVPVTLNTGNVYGAVSMRIGT